MKVRIKFRKCGYLKFIGHLDVMRYFQKAFRRAELDMVYSKGYSPHPLMSFASPLGVGLTSDGEYLDVQLNRADAPEDMICRINAAMAEGMEVSDFKILPDSSKTAMSLITAADYLLSLKDGYGQVHQYEQIFDAFMSQQSILIQKKTKSGETEADIRPWIHQYSFNPQHFTSVKSCTAQRYENGQVIYLNVAAGSVLNLKPELVMAAFYQYMGQILPPFSYQYHRLEMYAGERSLLYAETLD